MIGRVQKTSEGYAIVLSPEQLRELNVAEGSSVEIKPIESSSERPRPEIVYVSTEEAMDAYKRTLPDHESTYRELAK